MLNSFCQRLVIFLVLFFLLFSISCQQTGQKKQRPYPFKVSEFEIIKNRLTYRDVIDKYGLPYKVNGDTVTTLHYVVENGKEVRIEIFGKMLEDRVMSVAVFDGEKLERKLYP